MVKRERKYFSNNEVKIMEIMYAEGRPMSIREIETKSGISWITVRKWLRRLRKKEFAAIYEMLKPGEKDKSRQKWVLNYKKIDEFLD
jgi:transposase